MKTETITDHELSIIANDWAKEIPYENIGIRTAFAAGYRLAEQQANGAKSKDGKLPIPHVSNSLPDDVPLFIDWLDKYYTHAGNDDLYKRKDNGKIEPQRKLYNDYKRAYKLGNDC